MIPWLRIFGGLVVAMLGVAVVISFVLHSPAKSRSVGAKQPVDLASLPAASCAGPSHLTIVAHEDDDVLFMNPDISRSIQAGECNWTIYMTVGDAGQGEAYWSRREQGAEAAYAAMSGEQKPWVRQTVKLSEHHVVIIASPRDNPRLGLIFMRLPDGDTDGGGYAKTGHESLEHLVSGGLAAVHAADGSSTYTSIELVAALRQLMSHYAPTEIHTQAAQSVDGPPDHSDHLAVGQLARRAYAGYHPSQAIALKFYLGYEVAALPANVAGADLESKRAAFLAYARFDHDICPMTSCLILPPKYSNYLARQYESER